MSRRVRLLLLGGIAVAGAILIGLALATRNRELGLAAFTPMLVAVILVVQTAVFRKNRDPSSRWAGTPRSVAWAAVILAALVAVIFGITAALYGWARALIEGGIYLAAAIVAIGFAVYRLRRRNVVP